MSSTVPVSGQFPDDVIDSPTDDTDESPDNNDANSGRVGVGDRDWPKKTHWPMSKWCPCFGYVVDGEMVFGVCGCSLALDGGVQLSGRVE